MSATALRILSPALEQASAIAGFIRRGRPGTELVGVTLPSELPPAVRSPFDRIEPFDPAALEALPPVIPTGARSTEMLLRRGNITLGAVTMTTTALGFYDKAWSLAAAEQAGIPVPRTWPSRDAIGAFPVFYKSKSEGGGVRGVARSAGEIPDDDDLIYQEFVDSPGTYGVTLVAEAGRVLAIHAHHEIESYPAVGGSAVAIEKHADERLTSHATRLVAATGFSGWGLVEFKYSPPRHDYVFMELNAKFWATTEFAFRNEPKFGQLLFGLASCGPPTPRMVFMHRAFLRGPRFLAQRLPALAAGAELRFVPGHWQKPLARAFVPPALLPVLRRLRGR